MKKNNNKTIQVIRQAKLGVLTWRQLRSTYTKQQCCGAFHSFISYKFLCSHSEFRFWMFSRNIFSDSFTPLLLYSGSNKFKHKNSIVTCGDEERLCSTAYGTPGTVHSVCLPYLPPSPYSASSGEVEALGPDPKYSQSQCETVYLSMKEKQTFHIDSIVLQNLGKKIHLSEISRRY